MLNDHTTFKLLSPMMAFLFHVDRNLSGMPCATGLNNGDSKQHLHTGRTVLHVASRLNILELRLLQTSHARAGRKSILTVNQAGKRLLLTEAHVEIIGGSMK